MKPTSTTLLAVEELHRASRKSSTAMPACRRTARSVPSAKSLVWRGRVTLRPVPGWRHTSWLPGPSRSNSYPNRLRRRATSRYLKPASRPTRGPERPRASPLSPYSQRPLESCAIQQDPRARSRARADRVSRHPRIAVSRRAATDRRAPCMTPRSCAQVRVRFRRSHRRYVPRQPTPEHQRWWRGIRVLPVVQSEVGS